MENKRETYSFIIFMLGLLIGSVFFGIAALCERGVYILIAIAFIFLFTFLSDIVLNYNSYRHKTIKRYIAEFMNMSAVLLGTLIIAFFSMILGIVIVFGINDLVAENKVETFIVKDLKPVGDKVCGVREGEVYCVQGDDKLLYLVKAGRVDKAKVTLTKKVGLCNSSITVDIKTTPLKNGE